MRDVQLADLRRAVGIVFDDTFLFSDTVRENIAFADPRGGDGRRASAPPGSPVPTSSSRTCPTGTTPSSASTASRCRAASASGIAIARAVLADPRVLILDDATSSVDPTKEHEIRAALREVMAGRTTLIIAHRPATVALADRVVLLDGGRVVAEGTHDELLERSERYREVLASAAAREQAPSPESETVA